MCDTHRAFCPCSCSRAVAPKLLVARVVRSRLDPTCSHAMRRHGLCKASLRFGGCAWPVHCPGNLWLGDPSSCSAEAEAIKACAKNVLQALQAGRCLESSRLVLSSRRFCGSAAKLCLHQSPSGGPLPGCFEGGDYRRHAAGSTAEHLKQPLSPSSPDKCLTVAEGSDLIDWTC